nr:immunoglobulin heavy chain junction region [Macaca mulatta]
CARGTGAILVFFDYW